MENVVKQTNEMPKEIFATRHERPKMTRKFYTAIAQRMVFHGATDALIADVAELLQENGKFDQEKYWDYVRLCQKHKEDFDVAELLQENGKSDQEKYWDYVRLCQKHKEDL